MQVSSYLPRIILSALFRLPEESALGFSHSLRKYKKNFKEEEISPSGSSFIGQTHNLLEFHYKPLEPSCEGAGDVLNELWDISWPMRVLSYRGASSRLGLGFGVHSLYATKTLGEFYGHFWSHRLRFLLETSLEIRKYVTHFSCVSPKTGGLL